MDIFREMVSNKKIRFKDEKYNLDLTYITNRIIAMAYPASGFESLYRNHIDDVSKLMSERHPDGFLVINASNKEYDFQKFDNSVYSIVWPNHFPCPLKAFVTAVFDAIDFLVQNPHKVIAIHCKAGKGRTGSLTCAILTAAGAFDSIFEANEYYFKQRAVKVTLPSQLRYLDYFEKFFQLGCQSLCFKPKRVHAVRLTTSSKAFLKGESYRIKFYDFAKDNVVLAKVVINDSSISVFQDQHGNERYECKSNTVAWKDHTAIDILFNLKQKRVMGKKKLLRANFSMLGERGSQIVFKKADVEKPKRIPDDLEIIFDLIELADADFQKKNEEAFRALEDRAAKLKEARKAKGFSEAVVNGGDEERKRTYLKVV